MRASPAAAKARFPLVVVFALVLVLSRPAAVLVLVIESAGRCPNRSSTMIDSMVPMKFDSILEPLTPYPAVSDCDHEPRFAEHDQEGEREQSDEAERKWRSAEN